MERNPDESFADYKARRAVSNAAVKAINAESKGGTLTSRQTQRQQRDNSKHAGSYGANLRASASAARATPARLATHKEHLARMAERANIRAAGNHSWLKHAA